MSYGYSPFGTVPFGASGDPGAILSETLTMSDALSPSVVFALREAIVASDSAATRMQMLQAMSDTVTYRESLGIIWTLLGQESLLLSGTAVGQAQRIAAIVDTMVASGAVSGRLDAQVAVAEAIALSTLLATGWRADAAETVAFQDALKGVLKVVAAMVDTAGFADTAAPSLRITAVGTELVVIDETLLGRLTTTESLADGLLFYASIRIDNEDYTGWVLSDGVAASQYTNYPFNGFAGVAGRYYGTADDGLYELTGSTDDGDPIDAHIRTAMMDFGTGLLKRVPDVYVAMASGNRVVLKVVTTPRGGVQKTTIYTATVTAGSLHPERIKIGQGLESRYWQWELANVDGSEFDLEELSFRPVILDRRV